MIDFQNGKFAKLRQVSLDDVGSTVQKLLQPDETVAGVFKSVRDRVIFTDRRILAVNIQGAVGKKQDITTLPYKKVTAFSVETAGLIDVDSELQLYFSGVGSVRFEFFGSGHIAEIAQILARYTL